MRLPLFCLLLLIPSLLRGEEGSPPAETVLQEMEQTYRALRSYADTSAVAFRNPDETEGARVEFKIWFTRPHFFRLDATTHSTPEAKPLREVMWFDGQAARMWSTTMPVVTRSKIQLAGSKMFGSYAYHIPTLLEPSYAGPKRLNELTSPTLLEDEQVDGTDCYHVRGEWLSDPYELWIGKGDHLVRKILASYHGYLMEETHRELKPNLPIDPATFRFAPEEEMGPAKKGTPPPRLPGEHRRPS
ncbi:MAG: DUF2092 domain-containing protein [Verrucomicrobiota bacterium]|nr:DUF2092 domain-containing protein [Verrucomicrobiota bacterium]